METANPSLHPPIQSPNPEVTTAPNLVPLLLLLFFLSGSAALVYEIVWFQLLQFVIGSSAASVGLLLATFMGGMSLGNLAAARLGRDRHPLRVYAALELMIAAAGILLPAIMPSVGRVYGALAGQGTAAPLLRGLIAAGCLLPPTFAMGATLPVVARWVDRSSRGVSWVGRFYAGNTIGAVAGCLLTGLYLLRVYDIRTASAVAVAINLLVAAIALVLATRSPFTLSPPRSQPLRFVQSRASLLFPHPSSSRVLLVIALSGFCAMAGEVVWTRTLALLFGATVYTFAIVLAVFLVGLGLGSAAAATLADANPRQALGWCQVLAAAGIAWTAYWLMRSLPFWPNPAIAHDIWTVFRVDSWRALLAVAPAPLCWGASVPFALAAVAADNGNPSRATRHVCAANTIGAITGALMAGLILIPRIGSQHMQQLMIGLAAVAAGLATGSAGRILSDPADEAGPKDPPYMLIASLAAAVLMTTVPPLPGILVAYGRNAAAWSGHAGEILYVADGVTASVAVSRSTDGVLNYHNAGKIQASSQPQDMRLQRMLGHLTTIVPAHPRSVLVIGCGAGVTAGAVSVDPRVERLTIAEIEPLVPRVASRYFSEANAGVVTNPRTRIVLDDARHFLQTTRETFDAITSDPLDPWVKGAAMLYTREFFDLAKAHLNPGGVVTLFVQLYESHPDAVKSEVATFFDVFPNGIVWGNAFEGHAEDLVLLGAVAPLQLDLDWMDWGWRQPEFAAVRRSLGQIEIRSLVELLGNYAGRAADLGPWLAGASITRDRDLRLQYLAGLGLNLHVGRSIYAEMLRYRRFPADLFGGSEQRLWDLRQAIEGPRE